MDNIVKLFLKKIGIFLLLGFINYVFFLKNYIFVVLSEIF